MVSNILEAEKRRNVESKVPTEKKQATHLGKWEEKGSPIFT